MTERVYPAAVQAVGSEQITSLAASAPLAAIPPNASWATLKSRTSGFYLNLAGGASTSANMLIEAGVPVDVVTNLANVRVLQAAGGAIVDVWYWG